MQAAMAGPGRGHPAFPPQLQRPMQASPIPGSQTPARVPVSAANPALGGSGGGGGGGGAAAAAAIGGQASFTPQPAFPSANNQPRPAGAQLESLTREENTEINILAAQMMKSTPAAGIQRVQELVATYPEDLRNRLTQNNINLVKYYFRQAAEQFWRSRRNRPRPAVTTTGGGAGGLRAPIPPPNPAAGAASIDAFVGNVENLAGQQAAQARSAAERGQLVVPANTGPRPNQGQIGSFVGPGVVGLSPDTSGGIHPAQTVPTPQHQHPMSRTLGHLAQQQKLQQAAQQLQAQPAKVIQNSGIQGTTGNAPAAVGQGGQQTGPGVQQRMHPSVRPPQAGMPPSAPNTPQLSHTPSQAADVHLAEHGAPTPQHFDTMTHSSPPVNPMQRAPSQKNVQIMNPQQLRQFLPTGPSQAQLPQFQQQPQPAQQSQQPTMVRSDGSAMVPGQAPSPHQQTPPSAGSAGAQMQRSISNTAQAPPPPTMSQADAIAQRHLAAQPLQQQQQPSQQLPGRTYPRPPNLPPLSVDELRFMDNVPFPRGFLKGSENFPPLPVPDHIQRWAELKSWAAQNPQLMHPASAEWLSAIQTSHYQSIQNKSRQQAGSDQPPHAAAIHPTVAQAPLPTAPPNGQAKVPMPIPGPQVPGVGMISPVTEQDMALARARFREINKPMPTDDQLRYLIYHHRVKNMQRPTGLTAPADQSATQQLPATPPPQGPQFEQQVSQQHQPPPPPQPQRRPPPTATQPPRQSPAVQHKIPDAGPESQPSTAATRSTQVQPRRVGPQAQTTSVSRSQAASAKVSRQGPANKGAAAPSPPQAPPRGIKRPPNDEDVEAGEKSNTSQQQAAPPMQLASSHARVDLAKEIPPASAASSEQSAPTGSAPGQGVSQAQVNNSAESARLREIYREVGIALSNRLPVAMNEEARNFIAKELLDMRNYIRPIDHSLLGFMRAARDEKGITELVRSVCYLSHLYA